MTTQATGLLALALALSATLSACGYCPNHPDTPACVQGSGRH